MAPVYLQGHVGVSKRNERAIRKLLQRREVTDGDDADFSAHAELSAKVRRGQSNRILFRVGLLKREQRKAMKPDM